MWSFRQMVQYVEKTRGENLMCWHHVRGKQESMKGSTRIPD
jgi:hypothetical protein